MSGAKNFLASPARLKICSFYRFLSAHIFGSFGRLEPTNLVIGVDVTLWWILSGWHYSRASGERRFEGPRGAFHHSVPAFHHQRTRLPPGFRDACRALPAGPASHSAAPPKRHRGTWRRSPTDTSGATAAITIHDVLRGCWWRREVARQRRPAISWPRKGERRRARRRRLQLRCHYSWRQQRVRLRRRRPRRSISSRSPRTSAQIVIDSWHLSSARRVESHRRTCFAVSTTRRMRRRLS